MSQRRFGPVLGAGTVVIEKDAEKPIEQGQLGTTVHIGVYEKGPVGKLFRVATKKNFLDKAGSYIDDSLAPDSAFDFYSLSRGAGELFLLRVTDGSEVQSSQTIYGRFKESKIQSVSANSVGANCFVTDAVYVALGSPKVGDRIALKNNTSGTPFYYVSAVTPDTPSAGTVQITLAGATLTDYTLASGSQVIVYNRVVSVPIMGVKANNGGRWAGKASTIFDIEFGTGGLTATTFDTGKTMLKDFYKGAKITFKAMPGKSYSVISNTVAGVITVTPDVDMATDYLVSGSSEEAWKLEILNEGKAVAVQVTDGVQNPTTEFGLIIYVDGAEIKRYDDLSLDPNSKYYFANYINDDESNDYIIVEDLWVGNSIVDYARPANVFGQSIALTDTTLQTERVEVSQTGDGDGYVKSFTYGGDIQEDVITLVCTDETLKEFSYTSAKLGLIAGAVPVVGTAFVAPNDYGIGFTIIEGATPFSLGDTFTLTVSPFKADSLKGGILYPNVDDNRRKGFVIVSNTVDTITVKPASDMTNYGNIGNSFRVEYTQQLVGGYDGLADLADIDYIKYLDPADSPINALFGLKKGLVKIAIPAVTATAVQKAGIDYADARNYQFRIQVPSNLIDEDSVESYINDTIGRNDFAVVSFPGFMYVTHPTKAGLKLVSTTGSIHGREALVAKNYLGYHKAAAGIDVTIPQCIKLTTGDKELDEELLNKQGIGILKFKNGVCIVWGDRTVSVDPAWKWKHQREMMSYYENDLRESFDWVIFAINDELEQRKALTALRSYFEPEFKKRALRGKTFNDAVIIKVDNEINTDLTRANGDMLSEVSLRLADTVERFIITMSKLGIFENVQ